MRPRSASSSGESPRASTITRPIVRKSSSSIPRIVAAGVPMRTPLATVGGRDLEARGLCGDRVLERATLDAREDGAVDTDSVLLAAEDEARTRSRERLVRRRRDEVAVLDGIRMQPCSNEAGKMRHVAEQQRADVVGDLTELGRVDRARIRGAAAHDQARVRLARFLQHLVVVDDIRLARDAI